MKSTCTRLSLIPCCSSSSLLIDLPPSRQKAYPLPMARWLEAFSSNSVLKKMRFVCEIGETMGHQRDFTEAMGTLIGFDQAFQGLVTIIRGEIGDLAVLERDVDVFDQIAAVAERFRAAERYR